MCGTGKYQYEQHIKHVKPFVSACILINIKANSKVLAKKIHFHLDSAQLCQALPLITFARICFLAAAICARFKRSGNHTRPPQTGTVSGVNVCTYARISLHVHLNEHLLLSGVFASLCVFTCSVDSSRVLCVLQPLCLRVVYECTLNVCVFFCFMET